HHHPRGPRDRHGLGPLTQRRVEPSPPMAAGPTGGRVMTGTPRPRRTRPQKEQEGTRMARTEAEIITGLAEIVEEVTGIEPSEVTPEKSFVDDLDIDSLSMVEIDRKNTRLNTSHVS